MGEAVDGKVPTIDGQDLMDSGIVVHSGKHDRVDIGERLIDILHEYVFSPSMAASARRPHLKQVGATVQELEDRQRDAWVLAQTNSSVVAELCKRLADDNLRHNDFRPLLASGEHVMRCPGMMPVAAVDCRYE